MAVVNFYAVWGDKKANLEKMKGYVEKAAAKEVNILVFPELALCGYDVEDEVKMHKTLAETIPGPSTNEIAKLTSKYNMYVIFGMPERDQQNPSIFYNSAAVIGPKGVLGAYRKIHPWIPELKWCTKGSEFPIFETEYGPISIGICYDTYVFPEVARIYALKGSRLYLNVTAAPDFPGWGIREYIIRQMIARAIDNLFYVAGANLVGKGLELDFVGASMITGPKYPLISHIYAGQASRTEEEMLTATLDFTGMHKMRKEIPLHIDRRPELYTPLIRKDLKLF